MDQESLAQIQQIVGTVAEALRANIADAKRHTGVLTEGLRRELQLVAAQGLSYRVEVDGGITAKTAGIAASHGADTFVAGTSVFGAPDMAAAMREIRGAI